MPVNAPGDLVELHGEVFLVIFVCPSFHGEILGYLRPVVEDPAGQWFHFTYPRATRVYGWKATGELLVVNLDEGEGEAYINVGSVSTKPY